MYWIGWTAARLHMVSFQSYEILQVQKNQTQIMCRFQPSVWQQKIIGSENKHSYNVRPPR